MTMFPLVAAALAVRPQPPPVTLAGGAPSGDFRISAGTVRHTIAIQLNGELWSMRLFLSDVQLVAGVNWHKDQPSPLGDYWVRLTFVSGDATNYGNTVDGSTWYKVLGSGAAEVEFGHTTSSVEILTGTTQVEVATDSGGSNIVADAEYTTSAERGQ